MRNATLLTRIDAQDLANYVDRRVKAKLLAEKYGVSAAYVRLVLPKRGAPGNAKKQKKVLVYARKQYRLTVAKRIHEGAITVEQACLEMHSSLRTVYRNLAKYRSQNA